jgi:hypothetical protein
MLVVGRVVKLEDAYETVAAGFGPLFTMRKTFRIFNQIYGINSTDG